MPKRYIGDVTVMIYFEKITNDDRGEYKGKIIVNNKSWEFNNLYSGRHGRDIKHYLSEAMFDKMAQKAVSFGSYYTKRNRGIDTPDCAPSAQIAAEIEAATCYVQNDDGSYKVLKY